ncbi:hypothetical protein ACFLW8_02320 [Chloroflexota bacterium]
MEAFILILFVAVLIYYVFCGIKIARKAGYSWAFGLLLSFPLINIVFLSIFAFETWPLFKNTEKVRATKIMKLEKQLAELKNSEEATTDAILSSNIQEQATTDSISLSKIRNNVNNNKIINTKLGINKLQEVLSCPTCEYADIEAMEKLEPWCNAENEPVIINDYCRTFKSAHPPIL